MFDNGYLSIFWKGSKGKYNDNLVYLGVDYFQTNPEMGQNLWNYQYKVVPQFGIAKLVNITPISLWVYGRY